MSFEVIHPRLSTAQVAVIVAEAEGDQNLAMIDVEVEEPQDVHT